MDNFSSLSEQISNDFLQSIVFIDDNAFKSRDENDQHEFDAEAVSTYFSLEGKICAVYRPKYEKDLDTLSKIAKKADVAILDWQIVLDDLVKDESDDDDAEVDDVRGFYTKKIIANLLVDEKAKSCIKLIVIYTGEVNLPEIAEQINDNLSGIGVSGFSIDTQDVCTVRSDNCKIMVIAKSNGGVGRAQHNPLLAQKVVQYADLPKFISEQFASLTGGLLSNFAMESLSEIRRNFHHIVSLFSKDLDAAYLAHQSLLPNSSDANELLVNILGDTFTSIIRYCELNSSINQDRIKLWAAENVKEIEKPLYKADGTLEKQKYIRSVDVLLKLLQSHPKVFDKFAETILEVAPGGGTKAISKSKAELIAKKYAITLFTDIEDFEKLNESFANLCYHRNYIFNDKYEPFLTMGTIVKSSLNNHYYVCIQQRCDSVRLKDDESRRFLFISLTEVSSGGFNFLTPDRQKLRLDKGTLALRTVKFNGTEGLVRGKICIGTGKRYFNPSHLSFEVPERFEFIVELKDLYAQRIAEEYSAGLSRVGLDEPEWVRLNIGSQS